jgi:hypothetical protein
MDSHNSFGMSGLDVEDKDEDEDTLKDPREWVKVIGAFEQPRLIYNVAQKHFDKYVIPFGKKDSLLTLPGPPRNPRCSQTRPTRPTSSANDIT